MAVRTDSCNECGAAFEKDDVDPCPRCGSAGRMIRLGVQDTISVQAEAEAVVRPADPRDARSKLLEMRDLLDQFNQGVTRGATLLRRDLMLVFEQLAVLKDAVELEIGRNPKDDFAGEFDVLLAIDVGNLSKHQVLSRRPWSGAVPTIGEAVVRTVPGTQTNGYAQAITHDGNEYDAVALAERAWSWWDQYVPPRASGLEGGDQT